MMPTHNAITLRERLSRWILHLFPERDLMVRAEGHISFVRLSTHTQMFIAAGALVFLGWTAYGTVKYVVNDQLVASKENQIAKARFAYRSLISEIADYQIKFTGLAGQLEENHGLMLGLVEQNASLQFNLKSVETQLRTTEGERLKVISMRENLKFRLSEFETDMRSLANHNFSLKGNLDTIESDLQSALNERNQTQLKNNVMRRKVATLENRLVDLETKEQESVDRLVTQAGDYIESMERIISLTGLTAADLIKTSGRTVPTGKGGPFIATNPDKLPADKLKAGLDMLDFKLAQSSVLQGVMTRLPLVSPLNTYYITSRYGKRRDPVNRKWGVHYGLDMGGPFKSPVYAPSAGIVTKAGWKGYYGKFIEIDHGGGIKTRYGHLQKILVKKGQKVDFRDKIALLGNTGRSTGAHLHYEVHFRNKARNPLKFIKAGRYVFQE